MKSKILVVDDEPGAVELIEFNLKQSGFDVVTATDGAEALRRAKAELPALIGLDLMLPAGGALLGELLAVNAGRERVAATPPTLPK